MATILKNCRLIFISLFSICLLVSCSDRAEISTTVEEESRWYTPAQLLSGTEVFAANCAQCHGDTAQGLADDWREKLEDGTFPPPPLDGTAHAWHHPQSVLLQVIDNGGAEFGGTMPAFATTLSQNEKLSAIAYFQSFWNDDIYTQWTKMGGVN